MTGRYEITERIATGGMAEIYKGKTIGADGFEKVVVIKRILPEYTQDPDFVAMFVREAKLSTLLDHPNIVQVFDLGKVGDEYFITMEYIDGPNLHAAAVRAFKMGYRPFPLRECLYVIGETCKGLDYAHRKTGTDGQPLHIIHRDISPPNILLSFDGSVKMADFGVAKARDQAVRTRTGVLKGKFGYMSPEQAAGETIDRRSDVFALGVVLWELLAGKRLFKGTSPLQTLERVVRCDVPLLASFYPDIPPEVDALVGRALARQPVDRFQSTAEMGDAISEYLFAANLRVSSRDLSAFLRHVFLDERTEAGQPVWRPSPMPRPLPRPIAAAPRETSTAISFGHATDTEISSMESSYNDPPADAGASAKYKGGTMLQFSPVTSGVVENWRRSNITIPPQRAPKADPDEVPTTRLERSDAKSTAPKLTAPVATAARENPKTSGKTRRRSLTWVWWTIGVLGLAGAMIALLYFSRRT
jgi:serine/threonine protein kinase